MEIFLSTALIVATLLSCCQANAIEIKSAPMIDLTSQSSQVENMVTDESLGNKDTAPTDWKTPNRSHQEIQDDKPIDCFGKLNNSRSN